MKRVNITLFGIPFVGVEASSGSNEQSKSLKEYAKETADAAKATVHGVASKVASATAGESDPSRSE